MHFLMLLIGTGAQRKAATRLRSHSESIRSTCMISFYKHRVAGGREDRAGSFHLTDEKMGTWRRQAQAQEQE